VSKGPVISRNRNILAFHRYTCLTQTEGRNYLINHNVKRVLNLLTVYVAPDHCYNNLPKHFCAAADEIMRVEMV
jgi:hypothetical protein